MLHSLCYIVSKFSQVSKRLPWFVITLELCSLFENTQNGLVLLVILKKERISKDFYLKN